jgi:hypothetical protein
MKFYAEYERHLEWAEMLTKQVLNVAPASNPANDRFRADLGGLLAVSYVAAFECSLKIIFTTFASKKNKILGHVAGFHFEKINSKIHWNVIGNSYAGQFGKNYQDEFFNKLEVKEKEILHIERQSIKETYANLLKWRHAFAHEAKILASLDEVVSAYPLAKNVVLLADEAMSA